VLAYRFTDLVLSNTAILAPFSPCSSLRMSVLYHSLLCASSYLRMHSPGWT